MTNQSYTEWLASLKVGDRVIIRMVDGNEYLHTIRMTQGKLVEICSVWFNLEDGYQICGGARQLLKPTAERLEAIERARIIRDIDRTMETPKQLSLSTLQAIKRLIKKDLRNEIL